MASLHMAGGLLGAANVSTDAAQLIGLLRAVANSGRQRTPLYTTRTMLPSHSWIQKSTSDAATSLVQPPSGTFLSLQYLAAGSGDALSSEAAMDRLQGQLQEHAAGAERAALAELVRLGHVSAALQVPASPASANVPLQGHFRGCVASPCKAYNLAGALLTQHEMPPRRPGLHDMQETLSLTGDWRAAMCRRCAFSRRAGHRIATWHPQKRACWPLLLHQGHLVPQLKGHPSAWQRCSHQPLASPRQSLSHA